MKGGLFIWSESTPFSGLELEHLVAGKLGDANCHRAALPHKGHRVSAWDEDGFCDFFGQAKVDLGAVERWKLLDDFDTASTGGVATGELNDPATGDGGSVKEVQDKTIPLRGERHAGGGKQVGPQRDSFFAEERAQRADDEFAVCYGTVSAVMKKDGMREIEDVSVADAAVEAGGFEPVWRVLVAAEMLPGAVEIGVKNLAERLAVRNADPVRAAIHDLRRVDK